MHHTDAASLTNTTTIQHLFPSIPLVDHIYHISTLYDPESAKALLQELDTQCTLIMNTHSKFIPSPYRDLLEEITSMNSSNAIILTSVIQELPKWTKNPGLMFRALTFLHSVGAIALLGGGERVCVRPHEISRVLAKFISPARVRDSLLLSEMNQVMLLSTDDISTILGVPTSRYASRRTSYW
jgi:hypothetical protein